MDRKKIHNGIKLFLEGIDQPFEGGHLDETPERVTRAWADELLAGYVVDPAEALTWSETRDGGAVVLVRNIRFSSICVHHLLPFAGVAAVAYLPKRRLAGLSKIGRVVEAFARRLQIQERLTEQVADCIATVLESHGALVLLEAEHTCMTLRGAKKEGSRLVTMSSHGVYSSDADARREILDLITRPSTL
jgi:GTP cyclohydrolase I